MDDLRARIDSLESIHRRDRAVIAVLLVALAVVMALRGRAAKPDVMRLTTLTADRIVVLDHQGRARIALGEDPADTQRRSRACGINLYDKAGAERFGVSTFEDMSVVLGIDAPAGVGAPMRDRIGLVVDADGSARIDLIDNRTMIPVRLVSEADGSGGVEFFEYDLEKLECKITRLNHGGQTQRVLPLGDGK